MLDRPKVQLREVERIVSLPVVPPLTEAEKLDISRRVIAAKAWDGKCACQKCRGQPFRLFGEQAEGLHAYETTHGGMFAIPVGRGKTALSLLIASHFYRTTSKRVLLLLEPGLAAQFQWRALPWARQHLAISVGEPLHLSGMSQKKRLTYCRAQARVGLYVMPYSYLSVEDTQEMLSLIDADLVIADEAQNLSGDNPKQRRFWSWVDERKHAQRPVAGVAMSGTLTSRTPLDYHKIIRWTLGPNSPLPRPKVEAIQWAKMLASGVGDPPASMHDDIEPLLRWAEPRVARPLTFTVPDIRAAYKERLHTVPGFVSGGDDRLGVGLEIRNTPAKPPEECPGGDQLLKLLGRLENDWRGPNGDILTFGIEIHNAMRELSAGFYNRRFWDESHPKVKQAKKRFEIEQVYNKGLNDFFRHTRKPIPGLDTPMLVGKYHEIRGEMRSYLDGPALYKVWRAWKDLEDPDLPERQSEPVRVCDFKIRHAVDWATRIWRGNRYGVRGGILWTYHTGVAEWLRESLTAVGLPVLMKGGGATWLENDGSEQFFCIASIESHCAGKELQHHRHQLAVQLPRPANQVEQLLGRCHRTGQRADKLIVDTNLSLEWDHEQLASTLNDTIYMKETIGGDYKLLVADWNPPPKQYSEDWLRARGL